MKRTKIQFKNAIGKVVTGYAILTDGDYVWCFDSNQDNYGYTINKTDIVKIYK
jgi:hypothetical protein